MSKQAQFAFAHETKCLRCGAGCRIDPVVGSKARMLKRADQKGLCVNCAVHDILRHLYPANLILARSGPQGLASPHIQRQFFEMCRVGGTDAKFEEIDWHAIIANWELPFPTTMKRTATNPVTEEDIAMAQREGEQRRAGTWQEPQTEEEYQAQRQSAIDHVLKAARKTFDEDS